MTIEKFTPTQRKDWSVAIAQTLSLFPYMRDIVANINPSYSTDFEYHAAIDRYWRVIVNAEFFSLSIMSQCAVIMHETLHCVNRHFERAEILHGDMTDKDNIAADFEINTTLRSQSFMVIPEHFIMPEMYSLPDNESYEYYYQHLPLNGTPSFKTRDLVFNNDLIEQLDELGVPQLSPAEKVTALSNTMINATNYQKSIGNVAALKDTVLQSVIKALKPAKVNWRQQLSKIIGRHRADIANHKIDFSYRRVNRRMSENDIAPGYISYKPKVMVGIDVSGSMGEDDYKSLLNEIESIIHTQCSNIKLFLMDTKVSDIQTVRHVNEIKWKLGGGTALECGFKYIANLNKHRRPDMFIVCTDGVNDWDDCKPFILPGVHYVVLSTTDSSLLKQINFAEVITIED